MDRKNWNWDGDPKQDSASAEDEVTYTVDDILAEFWSEYSEPEEVREPEYDYYEVKYDDPTGDKYADAYEDEDGYDYEWEPENPAATPSRDQEIEEEAEMPSEEQLPEKTGDTVREQDTIDTLFHNIRSYFRKNENKKGTGEQKTAEEDASEAQTEKKGKKEVQEQFPDSPPKESEGTFVDTFDYSRLFKMFADPRKKEKGRTQLRGSTPDGVSEVADFEGESSAAGNFSEQETISGYSEETEDLYGEEIQEEEPYEEKTEEGSRPLLAEDSMDFRDILREFMLGDQHPIYSGLPGIGVPADKEENHLPIPNLFTEKKKEPETEKEEQKEKPKEKPKAITGNRYQVEEDFPLDLDRFDTALPEDRNEKREDQLQETLTAEPEPERKQRRKAAEKPDGTGNEVPEKALLRMLRGFGSGVSGKKKALNSPSAFTGFEDYLPKENEEENTEPSEPETERDPEKDTEQKPEGKHAAVDESEDLGSVPVSSVEDEDDELLYAGDFPPFGQWILNELMNLWIRINGIGDRASTFTMEDEAEDLGPEVNVANASRYYGSQVTMLRMRFHIGLALLAVLAYLTLGFPVSGMLKTAKVCSAMCLGLQLAIMLLCLDVVTNAAINLTRGKFGADALAVLCCVISSLDALTVALGSFGTPHIPLCLFSSLALMGVLFASLLSARALRKSIRVPAIGKRAYCVTAEEGVRANRDITLLKSVRPTTGFVRRSEEAPPDESLFYKTALFELAAAIILSLFIGLVKHSVKDMLYILSAVLSCAVPLTALLAFALPFFIGSQRIFSSGAAVAGWSGIHDIGSSRNLIVTDRDLFPEETISIDTVRIFADESAERIIAYAGTMIAASGSGLGPCFAELMEKNRARMRQVEDFQWLSGGGLQGRIEGHRVLCGGSDLMQLMDVKIPYRLVDRTTVLLAIDGVLYGIFKINYIGLPEVRTALQDLIASNRHPIFAIRDFIITPEMLRETFDVATDGYDFPPFGDRFRISEAQPSEASKIAAVVCREGLGPLTHLADTGRSMYIAVRLNLIITVLAAVLGMLLVFMKLVGTGMVSPWLPFVLMLLDILAVTLISLFMRF